ncbi:MAG: hypothetical protein JSS72_05600 [Armatimonadetes bacterium]|nr:hypothetical protein [Armatimonadota bacterium]
MKTVQSVKNSLKFKADPKAGVLSVKVGVKKYSLPVEARVLSDGKYVFLSFPASSELYRVDGKGLKGMASNEDASEAHAALTPSRRRGRPRGPRAVSLPAELESALKNIPAGYKLGYGPDGVPRLVRSRRRRK